jgi:hypothetical protein
MSKAKNNVSNLLAAIKRQPTQPTPETPPAAVAPVKHSEPEETGKREVSRKAPAKKAVTAKRGKPVQFWMHDEDRKLIRELSAWLAGQGIRPTDSMVIRAVLRQAKAGSGLLEAYWEAAKLDGRIKRD